MSLSTKSGSRSPYSRSRHRDRDRFAGSKRSEPERSPRPEKQLQYAKSNYEDNDGEVCMKKLSGFNESLRRQEQSTSTKFQWNHLLSYNPGKSAAEATAVAVPAVTKPEPTVPNDRTASTYSMSPVGIDLTEENHGFIGSRPLHLNEVKSGFLDNREDFRYPVMGSEGMMGEAVGFGEKMYFDSSPSVISQMAVDRIRKTEEVTALAYRKMEARASSIDSIVDKIDGSGELDRRSCLRQQYMTEQKREHLHQELHQRREDCSHPGITPSYVGFSRGGERVASIGMNHCRSPNGSLLHGERRRLPPLYPDINENPNRNAGQSQNGEVFPGESLQFKHHVQLSRESHGKVEQDNGDFGSRMNSHQSPKRVPFCGEKQEFSEAYGHFVPQTIDFGRELHVMEQTNDVFSSIMNRHQSPKRVPFHGDKQEFSEDYGHSLPQTRIDFGRELHVREQRNDVFSSRMNHPQGQKVHLSEGERLESSADYGCSLHQQHYLDLNVEPDETQQEHQLLGSRMNYHPRQSEMPSHGEMQKMQGDFSQSLAHHLIDLNGESQVMEQETEVLGSRMCYPQDQREAYIHGESQHLQQDCIQHISAKQKMQEDFSESLPNHYFGLNGESQVMEQGTEVPGSRMCSPQDQKEAYVHGESQHLQQDSTQHITAKEEVGFTSPSSMEHPKKHIIDLRKIRENRISTLTQTSDSSDVGQRGSDEDSSLPSNHTDRDYQLSSPSMQEFAQPSNRKSIKQRLGQLCPVNCPNPSNRKSIKHRLGPPSQVYDNSKSIKQRLGPPYEVHNPIAMPGIDRRKMGKLTKESVNGVQNRIAVPRIERHEPGKRAKENDNDFDKGVQARYVSLPVKRGRTEPPEDSDEFKQLIHDTCVRKSIKQPLGAKGVQARDVAHPVKRGRTELPKDSDEFQQLIHETYIKSVKVLYENPVQLRKYTDRGEAETLKCCVCGGKSEDFVNTIRLATHAFTSGRCRVEHLGLHKALCLFIGWDSMSDSEGVWVPKSLPDAVALAMKEDLVVWPPVVILHNSSIGTTNSDDRIIVSIEDLEAFLRGLREAERLHNFYAGNKHGRTEFERVKCKGGETHSGPLHKAKHVLYGIAGDLDKLDFETKSHSVIKSKKQIYAVADGAGLDTK